jgi:hypothetical protein
MVMHIDCSMLSKRRHTSSVRAPIGFAPQPPTFGLLARPQFPVLKRQSCGSLVNDS